MWNQNNKWFFGLIVYSLTHFSLVFAIHICKLKTSAWYISLIQEQSALSLEPHSQQWKRGTQKEEARKKEVSCSVARPSSSAMWRKKNQFAGKLTLNLCIYSRSDYVYEAEEKHHRQLGHFSVWWIRCVERLLQKSRNFPPSLCNSELSHSWWRNLQRLFAAPIWLCILLANTGDVYESNP